jgi:hypothetical protein
MCLTYFFDSFQFWNDFFSQAFPDRAAVEADQIVNADFYQLLSSDQVKTCDLPVIVRKAAPVNQRLDSLRVKIRERDDSAAGLIRPPGRYRPQFQ